MLYFSFWELFLAYVSFSLFGLLFGALYQALFLVLSGIGQVIRLPYDALALIREPSRERLSLITFKIGELNIVLRNLIDFIAFTVFGIVELVLAYVYLDGTLRIIPPALSVLCLYLGIRISRQFLLPYLLYLLTAVYRFLAVIIALTVKPLLLISRKLLFVINAIITFIKALIGHKGVRIVKVVFRKKKGQKNRDLTKK